MPMKGVFALVGERNNPGKEVSGRAKGLTAHRPCKASSPISVVVSFAVGIDSALAPVLADSCEILGFAFLGILEAVIVSRLVCVTFEHGVECFWGVDFVVTSIRRRTVVRSYTISAVFLLFKRVGRISPNKNNWAPKVKVPRNAVICVEGTAVPGESDRAEEAFSGLVSFQQ